MSRGFALIEMVLVLMVTLIVMTLSWRLLSHLDTVEKSEATGLLLVAIAQAAQDARTSASPVSAILDSQHIPDRFRIGGNLVSPSGGAVTVLVSGVGVAPVLSVLIAPPITPALCTELSRRHLTSWQLVRVDTRTVGGVGYGSSDPIATDDQLETACAAQPTLLFQAPL